MTYNLLKVTKTTNDHHVQLSANSETILTVTDSLLPWLRLGGAFQSWVPVPHRWRPLHVAYPLARHRHGNGSHVWHNATSGIRCGGIKIVVMAAS